MQTEEEVSVRLQKFLHGGRKRSQYVTRERLEGAGGYRTKGFPNPPV